MNKYSKTNIKWSVLILVSLILSAQVAVAQLHLYEGPFRISQNTAISITNDVAYSYSSHLFLNVWIHNTDCDTQYIYGALVSVNSPQSTFLISTQFSTENIQDLSVAYNIANNEFLVCWCNLGYVYGQRVSSNGTLIDNNFIIYPCGATVDPGTSHAIHSCYLYVIYNSQDNNYFVTYNIDYDINGIIIGPSGETIVEPFNIAVDRCEPHIAYNSATNEFMITYSTYGMAPQTRARIIDNQGNVGPEINVSPEVYSQFLQHVAYNSNMNEYLIVWTFDPYGLYTNQIWARRFDSNGGPVSDPYLLWDGERTTISMDLIYNESSNEYLLTWSPQIDASPNFDVLGYRLKCNGQLMGNLINIATRQTREYIGSVSFNPDAGRYLVAFAKNDYIYGKLVKAGPFQIGPQLPGGPQSIENDPHLGASYTFSLNQCFPNPVRNITTINYQLSMTSHVSLKIYTSDGKLVHTLVNEVKPSGHYYIVWDGRDCYGDRVANGIYFYKLDAGNLSNTKKMLVLK